MVSIGATTYQAKPLVQSIPLCLLCRISGRKTIYLSRNGTDIPVSILPCDVATGSQPQSYEKKIIQTKIQKCVRSIRPHRNHISPKKKGCFGYLKAQIYVIELATDETNIDSLLQPIQYMLIKWQFKSCDTIRLGSNLRSVLPWAFCWVQSLKSMPGPRLPSLGWRWARSPDWCPWIVQECVNCHCCQTADISAKKGVQM